MSNNFIFNVILTIQWVADGVIRMIGPLFVLLALGLITTVVSVFYQALLPMHADPYTLPYVFHVFVAVWLVANLAWNYTSCIRTSPGYTPLSAPEDDEGKRGGSSTRFCKKCNRSKPPRAHHCHVCKRCVLRMDHHCPWVHNCVGYFNHRFFFLFLFYMWLGCLYVVLLSSSPIANRSWRQPWPYAIGRGSVVFVFVLTLSILMAMTFMALWHFYLILTAQTTIEFYYNRFQARQASQRGEVFVNPFDLGRKRNLDDFFGYQGKWWMFLIPNALPLPGDGMHYPSIQDLNDHA